MRAPQFGDKRGKKRRGINPFSQPKPVEINGVFLDAVWVKPMPTAAEGYHWEYKSFFGGPLQAVKVQNAPRSTVAQKVYVPLPHGYNPRDRKKSREDKNRVSNAPLQPLTLLRLRGGR